MKWFLTGSTLPIALACAAVPASATTAAEQQLLDMEQGRLQAQVTRDLPALALAIAPDATYIHANGTVQTGAEFLQSVEAGGSRYRSIEVAERSARILGDTALTHGRIILHVGTDRRIEARYTGIYARRAGQWMVLSWQSTPIEAR